MTRSQDPKHKTLDRLNALDVLLADLADDVEMDVGTCPKCGDKLVAKKKKEREGASAAVVRCVGCGYFYVVRW